MNRFYLAVFALIFLPSAAFAQEPKCLLPSGRLTIQNDVISRPEIACDCQVVEVLAAKLGARSTGSFKLSQPVEGGEPFNPFGGARLNSLPDGQNTLNVSVRCSNGKVASFSSKIDIVASNFSVPKEKIVFNAKDLEDAITKQVPELKLAAESECNPPIGPVIIPEFGSPHSQFSKNALSSIEKKAAFVDGSQLEFKLIYNHRVKNGDNFTIDLNPQFVLKNVEEPQFYNHWSPDGFAPVYDGSNNGAILGIAAPIDDYAPFDRYLKSVRKESGNSVPIILVDYLISSQDGKTDILHESVGFYDSVNRIIVLTVRTEEVLTPYIVEAFGLQEAPNKNLGVILAHEVGHMFGLEHTTLTSQSNLMAAALVEHPTIGLTATQECFIRHRCLNPKVFGPVYGSGPGLPEEGCFDDEFSAESDDKFGETCELNFSAPHQDDVGLPFRANCDLINPTPNGLPFDFTDYFKPPLKESWGTLNTPYFCYRKVPGSNPPASCRAVKFCGDGQPRKGKTGEECDAAAPVGSDANRCAAGDQCGGIEVDPATGERTFRNCLCMPKCKSGEEFWGGKCSRCCPAAAIGCTATTCTCPRGQHFNAATGSCDPDEPASSEHR